MNSFQWLGLTAAFTAVLFAPYVLSRTLKLGLMGAMGNFDPEVAAEVQPEWAQRAKRAHQNAIENLVVFATLVICAGATAGGDAQSTILLATQIFFFARVAHYVVFTAGVPVVRTVAYLAGVAAQLMVAIELIKSL